MCGCDGSCSPGDAFTPKHREEPRLSLLRLQGEAQCAHATIVEFALKLLGPSQLLDVCDEIEKQTLAAER